MTLGMRYSKTANFLVRKSDWFSLGLKKSKNLIGNKYLCLKKLKSLSIQTLLQENGKLRRSVKSGRRSGRFWNKVLKVYS